MTKRNYIFSSIVLFTFGIYVGVMPMRYLQLQDQRIHKDAEAYIMQSFEKEREQDRQAHFKSGVVAGAAAAAGMILDARRTGDWSKAQNIEELHRRVREIPLNQWAYKP